MAAVKQTLQLRHQLSCSGITLQTATYDATRHHVLSYDSSTLAPHTLRLFSLRREIKSVRLFDDVNPPPPPLKPTAHKAQSVDKKNKTNSNPKDPDVPIVHSLSLEYSKATDVYICVYTAQSVPLSHAKTKRRMCDPEQAVYNVLFIEPASLKKLVNYPGPTSHRLRCVFYEDSSDRLVLAVQRKRTDESGISYSASNSDVLGIKNLPRTKSFQTGELDGDDQSAESESERMNLVEGGPMYNHIDVLQISKRQFKVSKSRSSANLLAAEEKPTEPQQRTMLCVEKTGPSLLHAETISLVCGSKRLTRLFGVGYVSVGSGSSASMESFLVEWRESSEQCLELIRRVMLHDLITTITLSPCSTWLFTGHDSGALRMWNVSTTTSSSVSRKRTKNNGLGSLPLKPEASTWHGHPISSLQVSARLADDSAELDQRGTVEAMVITADRDSGVVKHWRFQTGYQLSRSNRELELQAASSAPLSEQVAKIDLVGSYNCDSAEPEQQSKSALKKKKKTLLESALCTVPIFVNIDMGDFTENLLLVLREDVIHVLKVQTVMHVLQATPHGDDVSTIRIVEHRSAPKLVVLSGNQFSSVRILALDSSYQYTQETRYLHQLIPPASQRSASISAMECFQTTDQERSFVVVGWSTGGVEIHSLDTFNRVAVLQDPRLNVHVTAIGVVLRSVSREPRESGMSAASDSKPSVEPARSWGGLLKFSTARLHADDSGADDRAFGANQPRRSTVYVFAGTENGQIFGWKVPFSFKDATTNGSCRLLLESKTRVESAHSAHVVQFTRLYQHRNRAERLVSLGADGMLKIWEIPSLAILGYVNTTTKRHMSMPSCMNVVEEPRKPEDQFVAVGFEDGMLGVWRLDSRKISFAELLVASHHERRVTRISPAKRSSPTSQSASGHTIEFLTSSLDMTAIIWSIKEDSVEEKRYFDIGAPVVDIGAVQNVAVAALANEICAFEYCLEAPSSRAEMLKTSGSDQVGDAGLPSSTTEDRELYRHSLRPDTPTTHSDGEAEDDNLRSTEAAEHMVNVLRVPTSLAVAEDAITIPSALITSSKFTTKPVTATTAVRNADTPINSRKKTHAKGITAIQGDELCAKLQEYIESHGTNGTMSAEYLTHFLSTQRLAIIKRPDFAIRKHLQEQKMDLKTRLSVYDACEILLAIQSSSKARKGKSDKKRQELERSAQQEKISMLKLNEKQKANRKAVITFNILGEKSIRWEVIDSTKENKSEKRQETSIKFAEQPSGLVPASQRPKSPSIRVPTDQAMSPPKESLTDNTGFDQLSGTAKVITGFEDDGDSSLENQSPKRKKNRKLSVAESMKSKTPGEFPDHDLIHRLKLSHCFQEHWSRGYCWCSSCSELRVLWSDGGAEEEIAKCDHCKKRVHTLMLKRQGYKPHFSLRMILGVIVEVYNELLVPSHSLLFKSAYKDLSGSGGAFSIHSTLYRVFTNKFGIQKVVEDKIKLFMVSVTHYIREIDAIAVCGELLAMFAQDRSSSESHVPNEMVALCICCYSWFFSRAMVVNGDLIIGSNHDSGYNSQDTPAEIENGKRTHWQFVSLQNALLCAQEMLMYPLVNPGYLRNILMYTGEYAQAFPTKPQAAGEMNEFDYSSRRAAQWIEVHRFLRLLVGEWKQQQNEFRVAEQTLFTQPLLESAPSASSDMRAEVIEKLRLILSCFIFYDHERDGVMVIDDFTSILRKLRYLWPNENVTVEETASAAADEVSLTFENTILAARRRFADVEGDGQICYLDFWAMLYIVGVRTLKLLKFREIPSFCRDYKLDISVDLHGLLLCYMKHSSAMMLPRGFQLGKSSLDQCAATQHLRRVGGLHDGVFRMPNGLGKSLSLQELLSSEQRIDPKDQIYLEGSTPALGQSASVSAMDRFRPVTRDSSDTRGQRTHGVAPVVVGVRHMDPREKPRAFISVSAITNDALLSEQGADEHRSGDVVSSLKANRDIGEGCHLLNRIDTDSANATQGNSSAFSSTYIQFPFVSPQQRRLEMPSKVNATADHRIVGQITHSSAVDEKNHAAAYNWRSKILKEHEDEERASQIAALPPPVLQHTDEDEAASPSAKSALGSLVLLHRNDHPKNRKSSRLLTAAIQTGTEQFEAPPKPAPSVPTVMEPVKRKKSGTLVIIPKIEKDSGKPLIPASVVSAETIKHRHPPLQESKPKISEIVNVDEKAAVIVKDQAQDSKPLVPDKWESAPSDKDENLIRDAEEIVKLDAPAILKDPELSEAVVAPNVTVEADAQLSPQVAAIASEKDARCPSNLPTEGITNMENDLQNDEAEAEIDPGGEISDGDDAEDDAGDQEETNDEESQDGSRAATPRKTEKVDAVLNQGVEPIIDLFLHENAAKETFKSDILNEDTAVASVIKDELQIPEPQKPTAKLHETEPLLKTSTLESHEKVEDVAEQRPPVVDEKVAAEKPKDTHQEPTRAVEATKSSDTPQCPVEDASSQLKETGLTSHHSFRFSQQPAFRSTAPALNNPFRSGQWDPSNDSDSDEEKRANAASAGGGAGDKNGFEEEDDGENVEDIKLQLTPEALQAYRASFGPPLCRSGMNKGLRPSLRPYGLAAAAASHLGRPPSTRNLMRDATNPSIVRRKTGSQVAVRRNNDADERVFSEAEEQMQQKWLTFFNHAEAAMFSPLKQELQGREEAQRIQEELQSKLMKKRQEQQAQDTLRLQQPRRESAVLKASSTGSGNADKSQSSSSSAADSANFRLRRMARESCQDIQNELRFGVSVQGECSKAHEAQYFFFEYDPNVHGSILTLRLHVPCGEAEVFMSTETKVPCVSDFMWRSVEKSKGLDEGDGQKLVLYSHDLARVVASVASARAGLQSEKNELVIPFYISVIAVKLNTKFALAIMASGQKMEPSRAIRMVDTLIEQFNELSKSFEGRASSSLGGIPVSTAVPAPKTKARGRESCHSIEPSKSTRHLESLDERDAATGYRAGGFLDRVESRRKQSAFSVHQIVGDSHEGSHGEKQEHSDEEGGDEDLDVVEDDDSDAGGIEIGNNCDSFQHLLESIGEKRGFGAAARSKSFFLTGPTRAQYEFIQDEETKLEDVAAQYSLERLPASVNPEQPSGSSAQDAIAVVAERRLSLSSALRRHNVRKTSAKKVKERLSPIKGGGAPVVSIVNAASNPTSTTLRVAKFVPKPVAYSLSSLDHNAHQLHSKSSVALPPPRRTNLPQVQSTSSLK